MELTKPTYASAQDYGRRFTDAQFWQPYVEAVCARHGLSCLELRAGLAGTNPVFVVNDGGQGFVVKFFETKFFGRPETFALEQEIYGLMARAPHIPAPALLTTGSLFADGDWPYMIISRIPGTSLGEVAEQVSYADKQALAQYLGRLLRHLHDLPVDGSPTLARTRAEFPQFMARQRERCSEQQREWGALPDRLIAQLDTYLLPPDQLLEPSATWRLTHCDLNHDHVLGEFVAGHWRPNGIIDFGDARIGDRMYELVALHLGLFRADKQLLRRFLQAYGFDEALQRQFVARAMTYTLLHEFNVLGEVAESGASPVETLTALAKDLWEVSDNA
jgi:hygromycin-B 7''-O-kinase